MLWVRTKLRREVSWSGDPAENEEVTEPCLGISSGIKNADPEELKRVASQPTSDFFFFVNDFSILRTLLPLISRRVCTTAGGVPVTLPRKFLPMLGTLALGPYPNPSLGVLT